MDISSKFLILDGEVLNYKFYRNFVYDAGFLCKFNFECKCKSTIDFRLR